MRAGVSLEQVHHGDGIASWAVSRRGLERGHGVRTGLEDTTVLPDGQPARDNAALIRAAAEMMPAYTLWLRGPGAIRAWLLGRGIGCRGSRLIPIAACGSPAFGHYHPASADGVRQPWAIIVLELKGDKIAAWNSFLDTEKLFPLFGLPPSLA